MAELKTLTLTETADSPNSIDIEAFGANGRLADAQIAVLALSAGQGTRLQSYNFLPQVAIQPWISSSATVGSSGLIASETFVWNSVVQNRGNRRWPAYQDVSHPQTLGHTRGQRRQRHRPAVDGQ